jgi:hypothetical protein
MHTVYIFINKWRFRLDYEGLQLWGAGFFIKPNRFDELKARLQSIVAYWDGSQHPNR